MNLFIRIYFHFFKSWIFGEVNVWSEVAFLFWVIVVWFVIAIINMLNYGCIIFVGLNLKTYDFTSMWNCFHVLFVFYVNVIERFFFGGSWWCCFNCLFEV